MTPWVRSKCWSFLISYEGLNYHFFHWQTNSRDILMHYSLTFITSAQLPTSQAVLLSVFACSKVWTKLTITEWDRPINTEAARTGQIIQWLTPWLASDFPLNRWYKLKDLWYRLLLLGRGSYCCCFNNIWNVAAAWLISYPTALSLNSLINMIPLYPISRMCCSRLARVSQHVTFTDRSYNNLVSLPNLINIFSNSSAQLYILQWRINLPIHVFQMGVSRGNTRVKIESRLLARLPAVPLCSKMKEEQFPLSY